MSRTVLAGLSLAVVVAACGGPMTADEYVDELNALVSRTRSEFVRAVTAYQQIEEPTLAEGAAFLDQEVALRREMLEGFDELEPPESLTSLLGLLRGAMARLLAAAEALIPVAETIDSVDQLVGTPELAEYEAANDDGARVCLEVQGELDDLTASGQAFAGEPWIPDLGLAVRAALGCGEIEAG